MVNVYDNTKIFILSPANVATGGIELLHQLAFKINSILGFKNVFIKYIGEKKGINPTPKDYEKYQVKFTQEIQDSKENILIVPEVYVGEIFKYKKIRKIIWRLSVDNYFFSKSVNLFYRTFNYHILLQLLNKQNLYFGFHKRIKNVENHWVQCQYIRNFLLKKGVNEERIEYLSDYLIEDFFKNKYDKKEKKNIICYNPKKGYKYTKKLIKYMKNDDIKFIPIKNMVRNEVIDLLKKAKIYIDFGHFPGKDRIPREASVLGCSIIISKMGAGGFDKDFPIDETQKIENLNDLKSIRKKILYNIENYNDIEKSMGKYREYIKSEEKIFESDLKKILILK